MVSAELERAGLTTWPADLPGGRIPEVVETAVGGVVVRAYPTLVATDLPRFAAISAFDAGKAAKPWPGEAGEVALRVLATAAEQARVHPAGVRELLLVELRLSTGRVTSRWPTAMALTLAASPYPSTDALVADLQRAAIDALALERGVDLAAVRDVTSYTALRDGLRDPLEDRTFAVARATTDVLAAARDLDVDLSAAGVGLAATVAEIRDQLDALVCDGFIADAGAGRLPHLVRYLRAARRRLAKAAEDPRWEDARAAQLAAVLDDYDDAVAAAEHAPPDAARDVALTRARWLIEELRVSLFAQQLGTAEPVSAKRIRGVLGL